MTRDFVDRADRVIIEALKSLGSVTCEVLGAATTLGEYELTNRLARLTERNIVLKHSDGSLMYNSAYRPSFSTKSVPLIDCKYWLCTDRLGTLEFRDAWKVPRDAIDRFKTCIDGLQRALAKVVDYHLRGASLDEVVAAQAEANNPKEDWLNEVLVDTFAKKRLLKIAAISYDFLLTMGTKPGSSVRLDFTAHGTVGDPLFDGRIYEYNKYNEKERVF